MFFCAKILDMDAYQTLFSPLTIGKLTLRNRTIRSAAFEGMSMNHDVTDELLAYHQQVSAGGVGMTTVAYASVSKDGYSFPHQLWLREAIRPGLTRLAEAVHKEGAAVSIQIGHTGNMSKKSMTGFRPVSASARFNLYAPSCPRKMNKDDINRIVDDFANAVKLVKSCGFDAVEVHAGHGYLVSQFLSPYTNRRKDEFGGSFENRSRFMKMILEAVRTEAGRDMALLVKMNVNDGFKTGISPEDAIETALLAEKQGADALILSGGFVSRMPVYVMRGEIPPTIMAYHIKDPLIKSMLLLFGRKLMKPFPFRNGYFMDEAAPILKSVKIPVVAVGGIDTMPTIQKAFDQGYALIGMARCLIENTEFVNELYKQSQTETACNHCNYCVAVMYTGKMRCYMHENNIPKKLLKHLPS